MNDQETANAAEPCAASGGGEVSLEARKWGMLCHLSALVGLLGNGIGFVLGPLVVWYMKKDDDPFINEQGKEALNFQLTCMIGILISLPLMFILIGFITALLIFILMVVFSIVGAINANDGNHYRYPVSIRMIK